MHFLFLYRPIMHGSPGDPYIQIQCQIKKMPETSSYYVIKVQPCATMCKEVQKLMYYSNPKELTGNC